MTETSEFRPSDGSFAPTVSVLICTRNRPLKLERCLSAVFRSIALRSPDEGECEVVVVDQSTDDATQILLRNGFPSVVRVRLAGPGISRARNEAIRRSRAPLLLFTDDDCIPSPDWISAATNVFQRLPALGGVFGWVEAYSPGDMGPVTTVAVQHQLGTSYFAVDGRGCRCFALMCRHEGASVSEPCVPHMNLGSSNNMAFRRSVFLEYGAFSTLFGAGSPGCSAEDTELQYRFLRAGLTLGYEPSLIVQHDNWLDLEAALRQIDRYLQGMMGVFTWYALRGDRFAWCVLAYLGEHARFAFARCRRKADEDAHIVDVVRRWWCLGRGLLYGCGLALLRVNGESRDLESARAVHGAS